MTDSTSTLNKFEWVKTHRHLQRIGTAVSDVGNILLDADIQRREGNLEAAAMLASAARTLVRQRVSYSLLLAAKVNRPKRKKTP
jgi:hypothetical protein